MQWNIAFIWILAGIVIGVLSGFMGVGGGIVLTPILLYLGYTPSVATATSLAFIIPTAWAGIMKSKQDVDVNLSLLLAIGAVVGTYAIGRPLVDRFNVTHSAFFNPASYKRIFGIIMLLVALDMVTGFTDRLKERAQQVSNQVISNQ